MSDNKVVNSTAIAPRPEVVSAFAPAAPPTWQFMGTTIEDALKFADTLVRSGLLPYGVDTPQRALVILLKGRELGLDPLTALSELHVIEGKPAMSSALMIAQARKAGVRIRWETPPDREAEEAVLRLIDRNGDEHVERFTWEEAERVIVVGKIGGNRVEMPLTERPSWRNYPISMLRARCASRALRSFVPDALHGAHYSLEELGEEVDAEGRRSGAVEDPRAAAFGAEASRSLRRAVGKEKFRRPGDTEADTITVEPIPTGEFVPEGEETSPAIEPVVASAPEIERPASVDAPAPVATPKAPKAASGAPRAPRAKAEAPPKIDPARDRLLKLAGDCGLRVGEEVVVNDTLSAWTGRPMSQVNVRALNPDEVRVLGNALIALRKKLADAKPKA